MPRCCSTVMSNLVARAGADGAHLTGIAAFSEALAQLKPERIAGAGGLATRHDAMVAAEQGADYVMFGEPDDAGVRPAFEAIEERIAWWAEVFESPCVGYAASLDEIAPLVAAGADFIALGDCLWRDPRRGRGDNKRGVPSSCECRRPRHDASPSGFFAAPLSQPCLLRQRPRRSPATLRQHRRLLRAGH